MERRNEEKQINIYEYICLAACIIICLIYGFIFRLSSREIFKNTVIVTILLILILFVFYVEKLNNHFEGKVICSNKQFAITLIIGFAISGAIAFLPFWACSFIFIFTAFSLGMGRYLGILCSILLLTNSFLLNQNESFLDYLVFLIPGIVASFLFSYIDEEFKVMPPLCISIIIQFVLLSLKEVLYSSEGFSAGLFVKPLISTGIAIILMLIILRLFSFAMNRTRGRMQDIIDSEFELMRRLKEELGEDFNLAVYTAILCAKIAKNIGLDETTVKALGYYHKVNVLATENKWEAVSQLLDEYKIPDNIIALLKEYFEAGECGVKSRENVLLILTESMISSVRYLFIKNKEATVDYEKLANAVIEKKFASKMFDESKISYEDISIIRSNLVQEKMIYDFLR